MSHVCGGNADERLFALRPQRKCKKNHLENRHFFFGPRTMLFEWGAPFLSLVPSDINSFFFASSFTSIINREVRAISGGETRFSPLERTVL